MAVSHHPHRIARYLCGSWAPCLLLSSSVYAFRAADFKFWHSVSIASSLLAIPAIPDILQLATALSSSRPPLSGTNFPQHIRSATPLLFIDAGWKLTSSITLMTANHVKWLKFSCNICQQCFFCKRIFSGTHILIFDWRPQYSTSQCPHLAFWLITKLKCAIIKWKK